MLVLDRVKREAEVGLQRGWLDSLCGSGAGRKSEQRDESWGEELSKTQ